MEIYCPHCSREMEIEGDNLFCSKCGVTFVISWMINTINILTKKEAVPKIETGSRLMGNSENPEKL